MTFGTNIQIVAVTTGITGSAACKAADYQFTSTGNSNYSAPVAGNLDGSPTAVVVTFSATATALQPADSCLATVQTELPYFNWNAISVKYIGFAAFLPSTSPNFNVAVNSSSGTGSGSNLGTLEISEFRPWGPGGLDDTYMVIYDNSGVQGDLPVPLEGWQIQNSTGSCTITLPTGASGVSLLENQTYLVAGTAYTLGGANGVTPDDVNSSNCLTANALGAFSYKLVSPDNSSDTTDTVASLSGSNHGVVAVTPYSTFATCGSYPSAVSGCAQWSWVRRFSQSNPINTDTNANDFQLVSNTTATVPTAGTTVKTPAQGSPAPQNSSSPYDQTIKIKSDMLIAKTSGGVQTLPPNRVYLAGSVGNPGILVIQRQIFAASNDYACGLQIRVTSMSEASGAPDPFLAHQPGHVADLRLVGFDYSPPGLPAGDTFTAQGATTGTTTYGANPDTYAQIPDNPTTSTINNLTPYPSTLPPWGPVNGEYSDGGGGFNTTITIPASAYPAAGISAAPGQTDAFDVSFTFAVDTIGTFWFGYNTMSLTPTAVAC
jgi:hypothetical protein